MFESNAIRQDKAGQNVLRTMISLTKSQPYERAIPMDAVNSPEDNLDVECQIGVCGREFDFEI